MVMAEPVADDLLNLEAMRKEDSSWHPCQVSFSSDTGLVVRFGSQYSEDVLSTEEEAFARLRFRSNPLQGDDCSHIKEGDLVLASPKTETGRLFFDAKVEKVCRVRHSKKIYCRCTFEIKWLCPKFNGGSVTVPSGSIMKTSTTKIDSHPTVAAFFKTLKCLAVSPYVSLVEDMVCDIDVPVMLEQQIEDIIRLADAPGQGCIEENLFQLNGVNFVSQGQQRRAITSQASALHENNNSRRSTRSQIKAKNPPQPIPEESNRALLSPLGARAALASLVQELPRKPELSVCHVEQEAFFNASQNTTEKHASTAFLDITRTLDFDDFGTCVEERASIINDLSSTEETLPAQLTLRQTKTTKPLTSDRKSASNKSSEIFDDQEDERSNIGGDQKLNHPKKATSLTHSRGQKGTRNLKNDFELKSPNEGRKLSNSTRTTRLTRSALPKEEGKLIEELSPTEGTNVSSSTHTTRLTRSALQKEEGKMIEELNPAEGTNVSSSTHTTRLTRSALQKEEGKRVEKLSPTEGTNVSSSTHKKRLTRSALQKEEDKLIEELRPTEGTNVSSSTHTTRLTRSAMQKEEGKKVEKLNEGLEESKPAEHALADPKKRGQVSAVTKETRAKKSRASPVESEINSSLAQEKSKKQKVSNTLTAPRKGEVSTNCEGHPGEKKTSSKKTSSKKTSSKKTPELRSSSRLRFLPRTRSQKKSPTC